MKMSKIKTRSGTAATEFAILLPLIVMFCLVAVDLGRYASEAIALDNAVRVGTVYGAGRRVTPASYDDWESEIIARVEQEFSQGNTDQPLTVEVELSSFTEEMPRINVTGEYNFETLTPGLWAAGHMIIRRRSTMQRYR